jgi:hypothetical protein
MKALLPLLAAALGACGTFRYARWPYRGPMLLVTNPTQAQFVVFARDGDGRQWATVTVKPNGRACFRWPFIHTIGYLVAAGSDTLTTDAFEPWSADGWEWSGQVGPVANPKVCR